MLMAPEGGKQGSDAQHRRCQGQPPPHKGSGRPHQRVGGRGDTQHRRHRGQPPTKAPLGQSICSAKGKSPDTKDPVFST